jgi:hypothetical protein
MWGLITRWLRRPQDEDVEALLYRLGFREAPRRPETQKAVPGREPDPVPASSTSAPVRSGRLA